MLGALLRARPDLKEKMCIIHKMKKLKFLFAALVLSLFIPVGATAQNRGNVTLTLKDSSSGEPVGFATVTLTKEGENKPYKYALSDEDGKVLLEKVQAGKYSLKAELLGYKPFVKAVEVVKGQDLKLGKVEMDQDRQMLEAASVSAVGNPIIMKKDTIEYNASSFKTTDNDMLEDLLKKLPGIEISEDGTVTSNGKTINKITIDGKTFFLDDPQLATKNIPAKIIEKVKVVDKKSEQAQFTGIDDGEEETVIDLSIMPGMMHGLFGNTMLGGGHDWLKSQSGESIKSDNGDARYQGASFIGKFTEKTQLGIILNGNNTNNRGFNDLAGSMMQGMRGGGGGMGRGQGGWGGNNGITTSWMGGLNGNFTLFDDKMELGSNYLYNATKKHVTETSVKNTHMDGYDLIYNTDGFNNTNTYGNRLGARIEHKFSENTSILFQPQFSIGTGNYHEYSTFDTYSDYFNGSVSKVNDGFSSNVGDNKSFNANGFLLLRQKLGKPGRTVSVFFRYNFSNNDLDGFNQSLTNTVQDGVEEKTIVNQRFQSENRQTSLSGRATYTEPLGKNFYLEGTYQLSWNKNTADKDTYNSGGNPIFDANRHDYQREGETRDDNYSNNVLNRYYNQTIGGNLMYQKNDFHFQVGLNANPTDTHNETNGRVYNNKVVNWSPQVMMWSDLGENINVRTFYFGRTSQPSTSQLMAVPDNTNPLSVSFGNPYLVPYFNHNLRGEFRFTNKKTFTSLNLNLEGGMVKDPILHASWAGTNGAQFSLPVNGPDSYSASARMFFNTPIAKSNFSVFTMTFVSYNQSSSYIGKAALDMSPYYNATDGEFYYDKFFTDFPTLDGSDAFALNTNRNFNVAQRVRFSYRNNNVEVTAGGRTRMAKASYSYGNIEGTRTWNNQVDGSVNLTLPAGWTFVSDGRYNWYNGYTVPQDSEFILNAQVSKLLFKNSVTLALKAYDILNKAKNLSVTDTANYHQESLNNTLGRYVMLSVTFRFGDFGNMKNARGPMGGRGPGGRGPRGR